jgi:hypothetical protein
MTYATLRARKGEDNTPLSIPKPSFNDNITVFGYYTSNNNLSNQSKYRFSSQERIISTSVIKAYKQLVLHMSITICIAESKFI